MSIDSRHKSAQGGLVLILVLILLVVMTLLGTAGMRTAMIEEQMAGSTYDRLIARSASDAAIADGADYVLQQAGPAPSVYTQIAGTEAQDGWTVLSWRQANTVWDPLVNSKAIALGSGGIGTSTRLKRGDGASTSVLSANPTYIINRLPDSLSKDGLQVWRVTARGVGGRATTESYSEVVIAVPGN